MSRKQISPIWLKGASCIQMNACVYKVKVPDLTTKVIHFTTKLTLNSLIFYSVQLHVTLSSVF